MADYCYNRIEIHNNDYENIIKNLSSLNHPFDFNKVIHQPDELNLSDPRFETLYGPHALSYFITNRDTEYKSDQELINYFSRWSNKDDVNILRLGPPYTDMQEYLYKLDNTKLDSLYEYGKLLHSNLDKYGVSSWVDYRYDNWGTKHNAFYSVTEHNIIHFCSAWNSPKLVIEELSKRFDFSLWLMSENKLGWSVLEFSKGKQIIARLNYESDRKKIIDAHNRSKKLFKKWENDQNT